MKNIMKYSKLKLTIGITAGIILASGAMTLAIAQTTGDPTSPPSAIVNPMAFTNTASPLHFDPGPVGGDKAVRDFLGKNSRQLRFGSTDTDNLTIQPPLPMYRLRARNTIVTAGLEAPTRDGFLYPVLQGDKEVVDVYVHKNATGGTANTRNIYGEWFPENGPG